jgi:hypothetical protein
MTNSCGRAYYNRFIDDFESIEKDMEELWEDATN